MALKTSRFDVTANVSIDQKLCNQCGTCVAVCRGAPLRLEDGKVQVDQSRGFGCIGCGQCVAVCPRGAISVEGRDLCSDDVLPLPPRDSVASFDALRALLATRRSVRDFRDGDVAPELVERVLEAASAAPMGLPPSDVRVIVFQGRSEVAELAKVLLAKLKTWKWMGSSWGAALLRPIYGKSLTDTLRDFVLPVTETYEEKAHEGVDWFFYGAPLALYFHASAKADPADAVVAATYAMIAAHALGLGGTMLGLPGIIFKQSKDLKRDYGIDPDAEAGMMLILGHPKHAYRRILRRRFAEVRTVGPLNGS